MKVLLVEWPDVCNVPQCKFDLNVPRAELQKLSKGRGMRERRKVKHVNMSVYRDLENMYSETQMGSFLKGLSELNRSSPCYYVFILQGQNGVWNRAFLFPPSLSSLPPHTSNPDYLGADNLSLAENAKTVHFSQTLKNSN